MNKIINNAVILFKLSFHIIYSTLFVCLKITEKCTRDYFTYMNVIIHLLNCKRRTIISRIDECTVFSVYIYLLFSRCMKLRKLDIISTSNIDIKISNYFATSFILRISLFCMNRCKKWRVSLVPFLWSRVAVFLVPSITIIYNK